MIPSSPARRPFLVCVHDATPAHARATELVLRDLAPLVGRRLCLAVVPDWHGRWPLAAHPGFCRLVAERAEELLLHGYAHRRRYGRGPITWLTGGNDEMNGLSRAATRRALARGQRVFADAFGARARGFLAPAWQRGRVPGGLAEAAGLEHVLGYFALEGTSGGKIPLATSTWDCGRWGWLGHAGHGLGWLARSARRGVPALAIHPRDRARGFWPGILRLIRELLDTGHEPSTPAKLLEARDAEVAA